MYENGAALKRLLQQEGGGEAKGGGAAASLSAAPPLASASARQDVYGAAWRGGSHMQRAGDSRGGGSGGRGPGQGGRAAQELPATEPACHVAYAEGGRNAPEAGARERRPLLSLGGKRGILRDWDLSGVTLLCSDPPVQSVSLLYSVCVCGAFLPRALFETSAYMIQRKIRGKSLANSQAAVTMSRGALV